MTLAARSRAHVRAASMVLLSGLVGAAAAISLGSCGLNTDPGNLKNNGPIQWGYPVAKRGLVETSSYGRRWGRMHRGVDIAPFYGPYQPGNDDVPSQVPYGSSTLYSVCKGKITAMKSGCIEGDTGCGNGYGNYIALECDEAVPGRVGQAKEVFYAHLRTVESGLRVGDSVEPCQVIGEIGNTGSSSAAHLHFEQSMPGGANTVDPASLLTALLSEGQDCTSYEKTDSAVSMELNWVQDTTTGSENRCDFEVSSQVELTSVKLHIERKVAPGEASEDEAPHVEEIHVEAVSPSRRSTVGAANPSADPDALLPLYHYALGKHPCPSDEDLLIHAWGLYDADGDTQRPEHRTTAIGQLGHSRPLRVGNGEVVGRPFIRQLDPLIPHEHIDGQALPRYEIGVQGYYVEMRSFKTIRDIEVGATSIGNPQAPDANMAHVSTLTGAASSIVLLNEGKENVEGADPQYRYEKRRDRKLASIPERTIRFFEPLLMPTVAVAYTFDAPRPMSYRLYLCTDGPCTEGRLGTTANVSFDFSMATPPLP